MTIYQTIRNEQQDANLDNRNLMKTRSIKHSNGQSESTDTNSSHPNSSTVQCTQHSCSAGSNRFIIILSTASNCLSSDGIEMLDVDRSQWHSWCSRYLAGLRHYLSQEEGEKYVCILLWLTCIHVGHKVSRNQWQANLLHHMGSSMINPLH